MERDTDIMASRDPGSRSARFSERLRSLSAPGRGSETDGPAPVELTRRGENGCSGLGLEGRNPNVLVGESALGREACVAVGRSPSRTGREIITRRDSGHGATQEAVRFVFGEPVSASLHPVRKR